MKTALKHYICGFNGFRQVELFQSNAEKCKQEGLSKDASHGLKGAVRKIEENLTSDEKNEKLKPFFSVPQEGEAEIKLCTWSNIWSINDSGKICCYGNSSLSVMTELQSERRNSTATLVKTGKNVLLQDDLDTILIQDAGAVSKLMADVDQVSLVDGTRECVYGVKDGQCFEGKVQEMREEQDVWRLCLHPITVKIDVKTVSSGFEHTLILTKQCGVYSYGCGSRGQLGHGEVTVDLLKAPRCVDTFTGISVVAIAAGGWHSAAVTDTGDVYVWGWNESGQLGLPNGTISTYKNLETNTRDTDVETSSILDKESKTKNEKFERSNAGSDTFHKAGIAKEEKGFETKEYERKLADADEENVENKFDESNLTENLDRDFKGNFEDIYEGNVENRIDQSNLIENFGSDSKRKFEEVEGNIENKIDKNEFLDSQSCQEIGDLKEEVEPITSSETRRSFPGHISQFEAGDSSCVQLKFYQDIDSAQVHSVPYGLDLPDEMHVKTASCGSRHTCILTESGVLLTTGWNSYGQLCHGDTKGRDYLETVTFFNRKREKIVDVKAQCWNTYVVTERNTCV